MNKRNLIDERVLAYRAALDEARQVLGSYNAIGKICSVSGEAVRRWRSQGYPPRTEYTRETEYAKTISDATNNQVTEEQLLPPLPPTSGFSYLDTPF